MGLLLRRRDDAAAKDGSLDAQSARDLTAGPGFNDILTSVRPTQAAGPSDPWRDDRARAKSAQMAKVRHFDGAIVIKLPVDANSSVSAVTSSRDVRALTCAEVPVPCLCVL